MQAEGMELVVHYSNLAFMGLVEVLSNLRKISGYIRQCKNDILQYRPDVVILIDYGGFNRRMAKFARKHNIKVFYYIPPKVWAWYQRRALELKRNVDRMFVILPFEKDFFRKFDMDVDYVGNPVLDAVKAHIPDPDFLRRYNLSAGKNLVALLPGSRKQELIRIVPVMAEVVKNFPELKFAVAAVSNLDPSLYAELTGLDNVTMVYDSTYDLLLHAGAAIVTSGTATLETALFNVPQMVVYKTSPLSYAIGKRLVKVPHISLVNLIAGKESIKEFIQQDVSVDNVSNELQLILNDEPYRKNILEDYQTIMKLLDTGSASENAARLMVQALQE